MNTEQKLTRLMELTEEIATLKAKITERMNEVRVLLGEGTEPVPVESEAPPPRPAIPEAPSSPSPQSPERSNNFAPAGRTRPNDSDRRAEILALLASSRKVWLHIREMSLTLHRDAGHTKLVLRSLMDNGSVVSSHRRSRTTGRELQHYALPSRATPETAPTAAPTRARTRARAQDVGPAVQRELGRIEEMLGVFPEFTARTFFENFPDSKRSRFFAALRHLVEAGRLKYSLNEYNNRVYSRVE